MKKLRALFVTAIGSLGLTFSAYATTLTVLSDTTWKVTGTMPSAGWETDPDFDDSAFVAAQIVQQSPIIGGTVPGIWNGPTTSSGSPTIWLRKKFVIDGAVSSGVLDLGINDDVKFYINGELVIDDVTGVSELYLGRDITSYLKSGTNLIAAKAIDTIGPQHTFIARMVIETLPDVAKVIVEKGGQVGGEPVGTNYVNFGTPSLNDSMEFAYSAYIVGTDGTKIPAILYGATPSVFVRKGDSAPTVGGSFLSFRDPLLNGDGELAFLARVGGSGVISSTQLGLFTNLSGTLQMVAHQSETLIIPDGTEIHMIRQVVLTNDHLVFAADLKNGVGGVESKNNSGVWSVDGFGNKQLLLREGDSVNGKVVKSFLLLNRVTYSTTQPRAINSHGQLAARVTFDDYSQGIVLITIP